MAIQNLEIKRNTTYEMSYTHTAAMTGGTVYFTVKSVEFDTDAADTSALILKTVTSFTLGNTLASWTLTDADTYITPGKYFYDIVYEEASGKSLPPIFEGKFKVAGHPTNRSV